jgi:hypothetical protein
MSELQWRHSDQIQSIATQGLRMDRDWPICHRQKAFDSKWSLNIALQTNLC